MLPQVRLVRLPLLFFADLDLETTLCRSFCLWKLPVGSWNGTSCRGNLFFDTSFAISTRDGAWASTGTGGDSARVVSTIHFSKMSRCFSENFVLSTSFRASLGNCFNKSWIFINNCCCIDSGDNVLPLLRAFLGLFLEEHGFCLVDVLGQEEDVFASSFLPLGPAASAECFLLSCDDAKRRSYFFRNSGSDNVSNASWTKWKASLLPPLSGCTCRARRLKASFILICGLNYLQNHGSSGIKVLIGSQILNNQKITIPWNCPFGVSSILGQIKSISKNHQLASRQRPHSHRLAAHRKRTCAPWSAIQKPQECHEWFVARVYI